MKFEWDNNKANSNYAKHGVDFAYAARLWLDEYRVTFPDNRKEYSESRQIIMGEIEGRVFVAAFTIRNGVIRLISARKGNSREQRKYYQLRS